jgi:hypothetical protein
MIPRQPILKKQILKDIFPVLGKNKNHTRWLSGLLAGFFLLSALAACNPANAAASVS